MIGFKKVEGFNIFTTSAQPNYKNTYFCTGDNILLKNDNGLQITKCPAHQIKASSVNIKHNNSNSGYVHPKINNTAPKIN